MPRQETWTNPDGLTVGYGRRKSDTDIPDSEQFEIDRISTTARADINRATHRILHVNEDTGQVEGVPWEDGLRTKVLFAKDYCSADSETDDSLGIQAVTALAAAIDGEVYFEDGTYATETAPVIDGSVTWRFARNAKILVSAARQSGIVVDDNSDRVHLYGVRVDCNNLAGVGIQVNRNCDDFLLSGNWMVTNCASTVEFPLAYGVWLESTNNRALILGGKVSGVLGAATGIARGILVSGGPLVATGAIKIIGTHIEDITPSDDGDGIVVQTMKPYQGGGLISGCSFERIGTRAVKIQAPGWVVEGCTGDMSPFGQDLDPYSCISIYGSRASVRGNSFTGSWRVSPLDIAGTEASVVTVDTTTNVFDSGITNHLFVPGDQVVFQNEGGALPDPLQTDKVYYVITAPTTTTFTISEQPEGESLDITTSGTGTTTAEHIYQGNSATGNVFHCIAGENSVDCINLQNQSAFAVAGNAFHGEFRYGVAYRKWIRGGAVCGNAVDRITGAWSANINAIVLRRISMSANDYDAPAVVSQIHFDDLTLTEGFGGQAGSTIEVDAADPPSSIAVTHKVHALRTTTGNVDIENIETTGIERGRMVTFIGASGGNTVTFKDGPGNLRMAGDFQVNVNDSITFVWNANSWVELSRSNN